MKAYMALNQNMTGRMAFVRKDGGRYRRADAYDFVFEVGQTYRHHGSVDPRLREGFLFCDDLEACANSGTLRPRIFEVEVGGEIVRTPRLCACSEATILREIDSDEYLRFCNSGEPEYIYGNCAPDNWGRYNSGAYNLGSFNSGFWNHGNSNSSDSNVGDCNSSMQNMGSWNSGEWNVGNRNSGMQNVGEKREYMSFEAVRNG